MEFTKEQLIEKAKEKDEFDGFINHEKACRTAMLQGDAK